MENLRKLLKSILFKVISIRAYSSFHIKERYRNSSYRVTGWYFIYNYSNGQRELIRCPWILSNSIGGYGICGWYTEYYNIDFVSFHFNKARRFFREKNEHIYGDKYNWFKIKYFLFKKQGGDYDLIQSELLNTSIEIACKRYKNKLK